MRNREEPSRWQYRFRNFSLTDRNAMSHEYDSEAFEAVADNVHQRYLGLFGELWELLALEDAAK